VSVGPGSDKLGKYQSDVNRQDAPALKSSKGAIWLGFLHIDPFKGREGFQDHAVQG